MYIYLSIYFLYTYTDVLVNVYVFAHFSICLYLSVLLAYEGDYECEHVRCRYEQSRACGQISRRTFVFHVHVKMEDKMIINMSLTWTWKCRCRCRCFRREEKDVARSLSQLRGRTR